MSRCSQQRRKPPCSLCIERSVQEIRTYHVVIEQSFEGTVCNGRPYKMIYCFIFVVRDGLIHQVRPYFDTALGFELIFGQEPPRKIA